MERARGGAILRELRAILMFASREKENIVIYVARLYINGKIAFMLIIIFEPRNEILLESIVISRKNDIITIFQLKIQ